MAVAISFGKIPAYGPGISVAAGTAGGLITAGSFSVIPQNSGPGSKAMRNVEVALVTSMNGSLSVSAKGSSDGYITVTFGIVGTPLPTGGTTVADVSYLAFSRPGSLPA